MKLLDLPVELVRQILLFAVIARGTENNMISNHSPKRALRLRLVCKLFSHSIQSVLFQSRLLDGDNAHSTVANWFWRGHRAAECFWHDYLVYRVTGERDPHLGHFVEIRKIAMLLVEESPLTLESAISGLCWLVFKSAGADNRLVLPDWCRDFGATPISGPDSDPRISFLSAATYFNLRPLVERLLSQRVLFLSTGSIFLSPIEIAALMGNADLLELFLQQRPEGKDRRMTYLQRWKISENIIELATTSGDLKTLKLSIFGTSTGQTEQPGVGLMSNPLLRRAIKFNCWSARNPEIWEYLQSLVPLGAERLQLEDPLYMGAFRGTIDMVRHLLDVGQPLNAVPDGWFILPFSSCKAHQEEMVDLFLERGGTIDAPSPFEPLLIKAAKRGSLNIVRKLLDNGADVNEIEPSTNTRAIFWAFALEHTQMIELLLSRGASLEGDVGGCILSMAMSEGLDSMVDLIHQLGVDTPIDKFEGASIQCW